MVACSNFNFVVSKGRVRRVIFIEAASLDGDLRIGAILAVQGISGSHGLEGTAVDFDRSIAEGINQIAYRVVGRRKSPPLMMTLLSPSAETAMAPPVVPLASLVYTAYTSALIVN